MARSALARDSNCTKPHPRPGGILAYAMAPIGANTSRRSDSVTEASRPPTNTVLDATRGTVRV